MTDSFADAPKNMVERIARALHATAIRDRRPAIIGGCDLNGWGALLPREKALYLDAARAALMERQSPTVVMEADGTNAAEATVENDFLSPKLASAVWRAMVDAAIVEAGL